jgi:hypothetical protein
MVLDGRNRYRACLKAGVEPNTVDLTKAIANDAAALAWVISANIRRRHLTAEQKRELIAKLIKAQPEKSNRAIGKMAKADKNTVAAVRAEQEGRGEIHHVEKRIDTKGRKQPAKRPKQAEGKKAKLAALDMPTAEEAEESYQETLYDQACLILESMSGATRQRFFAHLREKCLALGEKTEPEPVPAVEPITADDDTR